MASSLDLMVWETEAELFWRKTKPDCETVAYKTQGIKTNFITARDLKSDIFFKYTLEKRYSLSGQLGEKHVMNIY